MRPDPTTIHAGADLTGADLRSAYLIGANLQRANLKGANLESADLKGADLAGATLPDGRTLAEWQADPLAGLCTDPEAIERAIAAWGHHTWKDCPLHEGMGIAGFSDVADEDRRRLVATFVALFDAGLLPRPA